MSDESWAAYVVAHNRQLAEAKELMRTVDAEHRALVDAATGLRRAILDMHGPHLCASYINCDKCEGYDGGTLPFPCDTYTLARDWKGPE